MEYNSQLFSGLADPIHATQRCFRQLLLAMSEPATVVDIADVPTWGKLDSGSVATLLTLCDSQTPVSLSSSLLDDAVRRSLAFHVQAPIVDSQAAQFAFVSVDECSPDNFSLERLNHGDETFPEQSATVVVQVESLTGGKALTLSGAGIENRQIVAPQISEYLLTYYLGQAKRYPLGIDTLLVCGSQLMAIPRSTCINLLEV